MVALRSFVEVEFHLFSKMSSVKRREGRGMQNKAKLLAFSVAFCETQANRINFISCCLTGLFKYEFSNSSWLQCRCDDIYPHAFTDLIQRKR